MERRYQLIVLLVAALIYLGCVISPPGLMDDVDAVQAQIAANMLTSGDWVTARLNGVAYLEKSPLIYWSMAGLGVAYARMLASGKAAEGEGGAKLQAASSATGSGPTTIPSSKRR